MTQAVSPSSAGVTSTSSKTSARVSQHFGVTDVGDSNSVFGARDEEHNDAVVLLDVLRRGLPRKET